MDCVYSVLIAHLDLEDLCTLYFVDKIWRESLEQNLTLLASVHKLPSAASFPDLYTSWWLAQTEERDWLTLQEDVLLLFASRVEEWNTPRFIKHTTRDEKLLVTADKKCKLSPFLNRCIAYRTRGISSPRQYFFLQRKLDYPVLEILVKHSLACARTLPWFLFLEKRVRDASDLKLYIVDTFCQAMLGGNNELAFYIFEKYRFSSLTDEFATFCEEGGYEEAFGASEHAELVRDQARCSEYEALRALNIQKGDVVNAIMQLTPED